MSVLDARQPLVYQSDSSSSQAGEARFADARGERDTNTSTGTFTIQEDGTCRLDLLEVSTAAGNPLLNLHDAS